MYHYCIYEQEVGPYSRVTIVSPSGGDVLWSLGDEPSSDPLVGSYQCSVEDTLQALEEKGVNLEQVQVLTQGY